jgi:FkbM family methyltransferase
VKTNRLKKTIKAAARRIGYDVTRFHPESSDGAKLAAVLRHLRIDLVLDVGANEGQYGRLLREAEYAGRIVSFEPLSSAHELLMQAASTDPLWAVHERCAIGDREGEITINIAGNNVSSSVLPMLESHTQAAPESRYIGSESVPLQRLDKLVGAYIKGSEQIYLKIDTQGFEEAALTGAADLLRNTRAVQLELSLVPLYGGQQLWDWFIAEMARQGFVVWTLLPGFVEAGTGRTLQTDAIFVRL